MKKLPVINTKMVRDLGAAIEADPELSRLSKRVLDGNYSPELWQQLLLHPAFVEFLKRLNGE